MKQKRKALGSKVWTVVNWLDWALTIYLVVYFIGFGIAQFFVEAGNHELAPLYIAVGGLIGRKAAEVREERLWTDLD